MSEWNAEEIEVRIRKNPGGAETRQAQGANGCFLERATVEKRAVGSSGGLQGLEIQLTS